MNINQPTIRYKRVFCSDLHHAHNRIVELTNRGVVTTQENHTEWMIDTWNTNVPKGTEVWHLGDFSFSTKYEEIKNIVRQLNGNKYFIKGNHCDAKILDKLKQEGFISNWFDYKEIKIGNTKTVLFHFPIASWNGQHRGSWHLHGHSHGNYFIPKGKILDVGIDSAYNILGQHRFFTEDDIADYMSKRDVHTVDHHTIKDNDEKY